MRPRGRDWSDWRVREPQNLEEFSYVLVHEGITDASTFVAQNCTYIQAVGGNILQIKHQKGFAMSIRLRAEHTL